MQLEQQHPPSSPVKTYEGDLLVSEVDLTDDKGQMQLEYFEPGEDNFVELHTIIRTRLEICFNIVAKRPAGIFSGSRDGSARPELGGALTGHCNGTGNGPDGKT